MIEELKLFLQQPYESSQAFVENVVFPVFGEENFEDAGNMDVLRVRADLKSMAEATGVLNIRNIGLLYVEGSELDIFDITLSKKKDLQHNRVEIQKIVRAIISTHSAAFIIFHYATGAKWEWRFTFCHKGATQAEGSDAKRYTFLLGPGQSCRTAAENFCKIHDKIEREGEFEIQDVIEAFDVEALSKEFFKKYKEQYEAFCQYVYQHKNDRSKFGVEFSQWEDKKVRDYVKKMLGRIVFLHFLQKKGWMGVPADKAWGDGDRQFMKNLFDHATQEQKNDYLDKVLEPLFHDLDTLRTNDVAGDWCNHLLPYGGRTGGGFKVPYLNGGLFESDEMDAPKSQFPSEMFNSLFTFLYQYNFTIDENDPDDAEVGVDPEMLGRIFENLLEDNKDKGAFYTPKEIVQYMCKESLIAYLQTRCSTDRAKEAARHFVETHDTEKIEQLYVLNENGDRTNASILDFFDKMLKEVKICDPAIGSGAFPMGLLRELFFCRMAIEKSCNAAEIKKHIIQQNIYGVDIEKGAVDIARLRFWLCLIIDEETPHALPNLDFKIMQGNSLLEQYKGVDLSKVMDKKTGVVGKVQYSLFENDIDQLRFKLQNQIKDYYLCSDHEMRRAMRKSIKSTIEQQIESQHYKFSLSDVDDICATSEFFLWHAWFSEVFEQGGFDIVIGNPPYISAPAQIANEKLAAQRECIINSGKFSSLYQKWDLYIPFMEFGIHLLCQYGVMTMIVPYPLTNQTYGKKLREMIIKEYNLLELCDLNGTKIFENATVSNCIPFIRKEKNESSLTVISHIDEQRHIARVFTKTTDDLVPDKKTAVWNVGEEKRDTNKHAGMHVLGDYCYISVGMVVNADEKTAKGAFKKEDLISLTEDEIHCRKYIEAKDIEKYSVKRVRYLEYNTERCPTQLRRPTFKELYEYPKLMTNRLGKLQVYLDEEKYLTSDAMFCAVPWCSLSKVANKSITSSIKKFSTMKRNEMEKLSESMDLKYLLGIMNSRYADVLLTNLRAGDYHIYPEHIRNIPIAPATSSQQQPIINLVDNILSAKKANAQADTTAEEHEIDRLVYQLYGLTDEEIAIIENN